MKERTVTVNVTMNCTEDELLTSVAWDICKIIKAKEEKEKKEKEALIYEKQKKNA